MIKRILHTSDWHLGRRLKEHDRTQEFTQFFSWLAEIIAGENIDALLVAGDIFDNTTPTVTAQNLYYSFMSTLAKSSCRHIVITSGNHDSPAFIDAPSDLLSLNNIHVIGQACANPCDEVLVLRDPEGKPELIVCAVPYLRDRDVRTSRAEDTLEEASQALKAGIAAHYGQVFAHAQELVREHNVPVIAMGHLFVQGGHTFRDDGTRALYVGTAIDIGADIFPEWLAYTALGHLHSPQAAGRDNIRYSGSPISMGFGDAGQKKSVCILDLEDGKLSGIRELELPVWQNLTRITGDTDKLHAELLELAEHETSVWVEVTFTGTDRNSLKNMLQDFSSTYPYVEILSIRDEGETDIGGVINVDPDTSLERIDPMIIFNELMKYKKVDTEKQETFRGMYREILHKIEIGEPAE